MSRNKKYLILTACILLFAIAAVVAKEGEEMGETENAATGGESIWNYPRPPRVEATAKKIQIIFAGVMIAETSRAKRVLETGHPPVYYIPQQDIRMEYMTVTSRTSTCEWKGKATYYDIKVGEKSEPGGAWGYPNPESGYEDIKDHLAFYPRPMDACYVDGERVVPEPGQYYGGWITGDIVGPFPGERKP